MTETTPSTETGPDLIVTREGAAGIIRLNRPKTLNSLTLEMVHGIGGALDAFEFDSSIGLVIVEGAGDRGLCAGGDIRGLYDSIKAGGNLGRIFWRDEYLLNARIASFRKPFVAFMDGIVMGGGVGISAHGRHRIVTEKTRLAMPEVGVGFFPDVGGTWLLSRAPGELGTYFGLTGQPMNGADAVRAGFADTFIASDRLATVREALTRLGGGATSGMIRGVLAHYETPRGPGPVEMQRKLLDSAMDLDSVEAIVLALERNGSDFAKAALQAIGEKSPTSLKLALRLLRMARTSPSLEACLAREYTAALKIFAGHDFPEGIRAAVIDKDRAPKWSPARLEDVSTEAIDAYFVPAEGSELVFGKAAREVTPVRTGAA